MKKKSKSIFQGGLGQLTIPVIAIALLVLFNLIRDPSISVSGSRITMTGMRYWQAT